MMKPLMWLSQVEVLKPIFFCKLKVVQINSIFNTTFVVFYLAWSGSGIRKRSIFKEGNFIL